MVSEFDFITLDRFENVQSGLYSRITIPKNQLEVKDWIYPDLPLNDCFIYQMNGDYIYGRPLPKYLKTVEQGYRECFHNLAYIKNALERSF